MGTITNTLTKTNYGLIYSTDGSLCVTVREDDVPFQGVKSFAVETGTTNLWTIDSNPAIFGWQGGSGQLPEVVINEVLSSHPDFPCGPVFHARIIGHGSNWNCRFKVQLVSTTPGTTFTASAYFKIVEKSSSIDLAPIILAFLNDQYIWLSSFRGAAYGNRQIATGTAPSGAAIYLAAPYVFKISEGTVLEFYWGCPQLEQLPFATSFTPSTRPAGKFYIPITSLGFNPATDDWVIAYWKKPLATNTNNYTGYNIFAIGNYTVGNSAGYILWGKETNARKFRLNAIENNGTAIGSVTNNLFSSDAAFNAWYFNNWHFEVVRKSGNTISYYVDGIKYCETTSSVGYKSNFAYGLFVGGWLDNPANNTLVSNLLISRDPSVWTDQFIKGIYTDKIPITAPTTKLLI